MSEPWEDYATTTVAEPESGPWDDFKEDGPWKDFQAIEQPQEPADFSKIKLSPYEQADLESMAAGRGKAETGMESGTEFTTAVAQDPVGFVKSVPGSVFSLAAAPGKLAYNTAADVISKVAGQPEYGGNIKSMMEGEEVTPASKFIGESAKTNPNLATVANIAKVVPELASMMAVNPQGALGRLVAAGFSADMVLHAKPMFEAYAEELYKPKEERDAAKLSELEAGIVQTFGFAPLAGAHAFRKNVPQPLTKGVTSAEAIREDTGQLREAWKAIETGKEISRDDLQQAPSQSGQLGAPQKEIKPRATELESLQTIRDAGMDLTPKQEARLAELEKPTGQKEPWQMTQAEYRNTKPDAAGNYPDVWHQDFVKTALKEGKPVPPEVLADYPDLQKSSIEKPVAEIAEEVTAPASQLKQPPPLAEGTYKSKNEEIRAYQIAQGFVWNGTDWVHPDYPGKTVYSSDLPRPTAGRVREELAKIRGESVMDLSGTGGRDIRPTNVQNAGGENVTGRPGITMKIMGVESQLLKSETVGGVKYDLFHALDLGNDTSAIRATDVDSGNVVTLKQHPNYLSAEKEFNNAIDVSKKSSLPNAQKEGAAVEPLATASPSETVKVGGKVEIKVPNPYGLASESDKILTVNGNLVKISGGEKYDWVAYKSGKHWRVVEKTSGLSAGGTPAKTKAEAIANTEYALSVIQKGVLDKAVEGSEKLNPTPAQSPAAKEPSVESVTPIDVQKTGIVEQVVSTLETQAEAARARLKASGSKSTFGSGPLHELPNIRDYAIIGAAKIARGAVDFAKWSGEMISEFGKGIQPHLDKIWKESVSHAQSLRQQFQRDTSKPTTAMTGYRDVEQFGYIPETEVGRVTHAEKVINTFGSDVDGLQQALDYAKRQPTEMGGTVPSVQIVIGDRIASRAAELERNAPNDVERLQAKNLRRDAQQVAQTQLSIAGQTLQTGAQLARSAEQTAAGALETAEKALKEHGLELSKYASDKIHDLGKKLEELNTLSDAEKAALPTPEAQGKALREKQAVTSRERQRLQIDIETEIAKERLKSKPWTLAGIKARAQAMSEFIAGNLLTTPTFFGRQPIDVGFQYFSRAWNQSFAQAWILPREGNFASRSAQFFADWGHELADSVRDMANVFPAAMRYSAEAMKGRKSHYTHTHGLTSSMRFFERQAQKIDEAIKSGKWWNAVLPYYASMAKWGIRLASSLDELSGTLIENTEVRQQIIEVKRNMGLPAKTSRAETKALTEDMIGRYATARAQTEAMLAAQGKKLPAGEVSAMTWDLVHQQVLESMREANLPADTISAEAQRVARTFAWNEREIGHGPGGTFIGTPMEAVGNYLQGFGIPKFFTVFANASSIGMNQALMRTVLGMFPKAVFGESQWVKSAKDVARTRFISAQGIARAGILVGFAAAGILRVRNKLATDEKERDKQKAQGHRAGTVEIQIGDGKFIPVSMSVGPFALDRISLSMIGAFQDWQELNANKRKRIEGEGAKKAALSVEVPPSESSELFGILVGAAQTGMFGGRTLGGLQGAVYNRDKGPSIGQLAKSAMQSSIPLLPAEKSAERIAGVNIDYKKASLLNQILPVPITGEPQKINVYGDPVDEITLAKAASNLTGGTMPWAVDPKQYNKRGAIYDAAIKVGWSPATPLESQQFVDKNRKYRTMTASERKTFLVVRGRKMKELIEKAPALGTFEKGLDAVEENARALTLLQMGFQP